LTGTRIHRHARPDEVVADFEELDAQVGGRRLHVDGVQNLDAQWALPEAHAEACEELKVLHFAR
jgi:hypothetical protein